MASMKLHAELNVRESFRNSASSVAKAHKKYWPMIGHLQREKQKRKRTSSMASGGSSSDLGSNTGSSSGHTPVKHDFRNRSQSFNEIAAAAAGGSPPGNTAMTEL